MFKQFLKDCTGLAICNMNGFTSNHSSRVVEIGRELLAFLAASAQRLYGEQGFGLIIIMVVVII